MIESKYRFGSKKLHELDKKELLSCVDEMWTLKNMEIKILEERCSFYEKLLNNPHKIWSITIEKTFPYLWFFFSMLLFMYIYK